MDIFYNLICYYNLREESYMRFVPDSCIRENMVLAVNLYDKDESLLLKKGSVLKQNQIQAIHQLGLSGIYIEDQISSDIKINTMISEELKIKALSGIKNIFINDYNGSDLTQSMDEIKFIVETIINQILSTDNLLYNMVDLKLFDEYTYYHSLNVAVISTIMGISLGYNRTTLYNLGLAAILHDIGNIFIPKHILIKQSSLTQEEHRKIRAHSFLGYAFIKDNYPNIATSSYMGILHHHEHCNGSGYPFGLKKNKIHTFGKIISIADVFDSLTSDRPYRSAILPSDAMEYIMGGADSLFDMELVKIFTRRVAPYPLGTCVRLSNQRIGIVVKNFPDCCTRPRVRLINKKTNKITNEYINLKDDMHTTNITIIEVVNI